jgi:hypothetical protein
MSDFAVALVAQAYIVIGVAYGKVSSRGGVFVLRLHGALAHASGTPFGRQVLRILAGKHSRNLRREPPFPWLEVHKNASNAALIPLLRVHDV